MNELKSKTFILRMTETEYHRLKKYAQADNMFMAEYVRKLINNKTNKEIAIEYNVSIAAITKINLNNSYKQIQL